MSPAGYDARSVVKTVCILEISKLKKYLKNVSVERSKSEAIGLVGQKVRLGFSVRCYGAPK